MVAQVTGLEAGDFVHTLGDAHLYSNHLDQARLQLTREPRPLPTLRLDPSVTDARRVRPRAHRGRGLRPAPRDQGPDRRMTDQQKKVVMVAAVAENGVIGKDGDIPWQHLRGPQALPGDHPRQHRGDGPATYEAIGHPLPYRTNVVVTRDPDWRGEGVFVAPSVEEAIELAAGLRRRRDGDRRRPQIYARRDAARHPPGAHRGARRRPRATPTTRTSTAPSGGRPAASRPRRDPVRLRLVGARRPRRRR